jgi:MFS family permease
VWENVPIRTLLLLMAVLSLTGMPAFRILMPVFAQDLSRGTPLEDKGGALALGLLMSASGVGALSAAIYLASKRIVLGLGRLIAVAGLMFGAAIIAFSLSRNLWLSAVIAPIAGFGMLANFASANTLLQTLADDDKRGRVMSLFTVAFLGMAPFGNLLAGVMAEHLGTGLEGAARTVGLCGVIVLVSGGCFAGLLPYLKKIVRPIYVKKGIITEVADGLRNADAVTNSQGD